MDPRAPPHHKGLRNREGENNCFLNVCIQALWHLDAFRVPMATSEHQHHRAIAATSAESKGGEERAVAAAAADAAADAAAPSADGSWACQHCTFLNTPPSSTTTTTTSATPSCATCGKTSPPPPTSPASAGDASTGHPAPDACVYCALQVVFTNYQYSDKAIIPPDALREALSLLYQEEGRFAMGGIDDASEALEAVRRER